MKTLFLSPLQNAVGGGGRMGISASFPSRSPPPKQPFQPTPTPSPGAHQEVCEESWFGGFGWFLWGKGPRPLVGRAPSPGGPGPKPPGDLAPRPLPLSTVDFLQAKFLTSCSRLRSSISAAAAASPWGPGQQAPEPCIPAA